PHLRRYPSPERYPLPRHRRKWRRGGAPPPPPPPPPPPRPPRRGSAAPPPHPPAAPWAAMASHDPNSPLGVWLTEEKEGKVRIEQCGSNLCGYSVDAKSNGNGEQVLINMKPGK